MNHEYLELTPDLVAAWANGSIVSRLFPDPDTCEEIVKGHLDKVFVQIRAGSSGSWRLSRVRTNKPIKRTDYK